MTALSWALLSCPTLGQTINTTQAVVTEGLLAANAHGGFKAAAYAPDGTLLLLADEHDGIRVLRGNASGTALLGQAHTGSAGDSGVAMAVDAAGNVYVTGTTSSGTLNGTSGTAFPLRADTSTNSFLARYDSNLQLVFLTFLGAGRTAAASVAATSDAVFVTGTTYSSSFPVTPSGIQQSPSPGTLGNGFVERFTTSGSLVYATVSSANAGTQTFPLPAASTSTRPLAVSPTELDFGIATSGAPVSRSFTVTNLTSTAQTFTSALDPAVRTAYTLTQTSTDCANANGAYSLAANASCHIALTLTPSSSAANDGAVSAAGDAMDRDRHQADVVESEGAGLGLAGRHLAEAVARSS